MSFLDKLFSWKKNREEPVYEIDDWSEIVYDRDDLQINDKQQREDYIKGCLEQIAEASTELENLKHEYNMVTSYLKDMEEIESLPEEEMLLLQSYARRIEELSDKQSDYARRERKLDEAKYRQMGRTENEVQEGCEKLLKAEEYQELIKRDLKRLEGEKQAYQYRKTELHHILEDSRSMAVICTIAVIVCILVLLILQYGFSMNTGIGYVAAAALGAAAITAVFLKYNNASEELIREWDRKDHQASEHSKDPVCEQYPSVRLSLSEISGQQCQGAAKGLPGLSAGKRRAGTVLQCGEGSG